MQPLNTPASDARVPVSRPRLHPIVLAAALSLIALSGVGIATMLSQHSSATERATGNYATNGPIEPRYDNDSAVTRAAPPADGPATPVYADRTPAPVLAQAETAAPGYRSSESGAWRQTPWSASCSNCAQVVSVRAIRVRGGDTGVGAVGGGVVGGLLGHQMGGGRGRTAMTLLGAVGGALAGNEVEKRVRSETEYRLTVRGPDGRLRYFTRQQPWPYGSGDEVRLVDGTVVPRR